jgi:group I intron endonuclease
MENKNFIYGLIDPRTNKIRYVGKTNNLKQRLFDHTRRSKHKTTYKDKWISSLLEIGLKPIIIILEECGDDWAEREIYHISLYENLTNLTKGGEGLNGYIFTEKHKKNISENHHDVSKENNPMYGKTHTDEVKEKLRLVNLGKKMSEESKIKMSEKCKGEKNHKAKLTEKDVLLIRELYFNQDLRQKDLASKFKVQDACIFKIVTYRTWKHI